MAQQRGPVPFVHRIQLRNIATTAAAQSRSFCAIFWLDFWRVSNPNVFCSSIIRELLERNVFRFAWVRQSVRAKCQIDFLDPNKLDLRLDLPYVQNLRRPDIPPLIYFNDTGALACRKGGALSKRGYAKVNSASTISCPSLYNFLSIMRRTNTKGWHMSEKAFKFYHSCDTYFWS